MILINNSENFVDKYNPLLLNDKLYLIFFVLYIFLNDHWAFQRLMKLR